MGIAPFTLKPEYWDQFEIQDEDLEFLYNHLLEIETPLTTLELVKVLVSERIKKEKSILTSQQTAAGTIYAPKDHYEIGQKLQFPALDWKTGQVDSVRPGNKPDDMPYEVITVSFVNGETRSFAAGLQNHILNQPLEINLDDPQLDEKQVLKTHGANISETLSEEFESNPDIVRIAGRWFPRALLVDINAGHLNLVEAILEVAGGGPLPTPELMEQIDLPEDVNQKLNEFSLNLALQEDGRFDEVGPSGLVLWYLKRLEPDPVQQPPIHLKYSPINYDASLVSRLLSQFEGQLADELEGCEASKQSGDEVSLSLIYPHLRAGTLPLCKQMDKLFPTALESPRVQFSFLDSETGQKFSGWVVRPYNYVYGLREWYQKNELIPGSLITVLRGTNPGEVVIRSNRKRPVRDWVRTAMIGSDGGIVFALLKHSLTSTLDERMALVISDSALLDQLWEQGGKQRGPLANTIKIMMRELAKLSPQGHVHAQELYAAVNVVRRCPPGPILSILVENSWAVHLGDLYFRLDESTEEER
jgi:hypothetical protein